MYLQWSDRTLSSYPAAASLSSLAQDRVIDETDVRIPDLLNKIDVGMMWTVLSILHTSTDDVISRMTWRYYTYTYMYMYIHTCIHAYNNNMYTHTCTRTYALQGMYTWNVLCEECFSRPKLNGNTYSKCDELMGKLTRKYLYRYLPTSIGRENGTLIITSVISISRMFRVNIFSSSRIYFRNNDSYKHRTRLPAYLTALMIR